MFDFVNIIMVPLVTVTKHIGQALAGSSHAQIFADADGIEYFVKYKENNQILRILANEYVATAIAFNNNLLCPEAFLIQIDPLLLSTLTPMNGVAITSGPHFGTKRIENLYSGMMLSGLIEQCVNVNHYPGIILFDAWLHNVDRKNDGNYLIATKGSDMYFYIIDHGHCFGAWWDENTILTYIPEWSNAYLEEMYETIKDKSVFDTSITEITDVQNGFISTLVDSIPLEWQVSDEERGALKTYIQTKRDDIESLLIANKPKFVNWP